MTEPKMSVVETENPTFNMGVRMCEVNEISITDDSGIFQVDRSQIVEAQLSDQAVELQTLGLSVYDQDALEQGILQQVDHALEELDRKQLEQRIKTIKDDILTCEQQLKHSEILLKALRATGFAGQKQSVAVKKDIELKKKHLEELNAQADALQQQHNNVVGSEIEQSDEATSVPGIMLPDSKLQESERERKIRLGEMTPFGNILRNQLTTSSSKSSRELTEFEKYLHSQAELGEKQKSKGVKKKFLKNNKKSDGDNDDEEINKKGSKKHSPLKKSILLPKKRKKKEKLGSRTSEDWGDQKKKPGKLLSEETALESEGSEYLPSESELEELERKEQRRPVQVSIRKKTVIRRKRQFCNQDPEEWDTDDSDWDYSDEETRAKRRKSTKKEIDDGNIEDYHERLKLWEEQKARQCEQEQTGDHVIEGGYKMPKYLWSKLYNYQKVGVQWFWELNQQRCGGILGDEMGLGKTVQIIAFLAGLSYSKLLSRYGNYRGLGPCIIVCPTTVMHQWVREFHVWWPHFRVAVLHESGSFIGKREKLIGQVNYPGCFLVTSYAGIVQHKDALLAKDWHYIILDEGHKIRNPDAQVTLAVKQFRTSHRLILSGSPMQNNLKELWSLFDFVFPGKLGTLPVFLAQMAVPITQGGYANASEVQVATAYRCATVLRDTIAPFLLRRMKTDVKSHISLPPKNEQVLFCRLTEEQRSLYKDYLDSDEVGRILQGRYKVFVGLIALRKICNHPDLYSGGPKLLRGEREEDLPEETRYGFWKRAGKMLVIESLLNIWLKQGHRVLLFTQSRQMLCIMEAFVQKQGYKYLKLDGGTGVSSRQPIITKFNEDKSYFLFLLTTRVGGLGVNLTGADRVVIYDPDWNPATDTQARERAWRIGQQNHVTIYRLVTAGTIEEKIYHRQIFKQFLCNKVLQDPRQRRFFKSNDLLELFTLAESERTTETAAIFAGTGSEVKISPRKRNHNEKVKKTHTKGGDQKSNNISFSASKLEHMKRLAQLLSKQITANHAQGSSTLVSPANEKLEDNNSCSKESYRDSNETFHMKSEKVIFEDSNNSEVKNVIKSEPDSNKNQTKNIIKSESVKHSVNTQNCSIRNTEIESEANVSPKCSFVIKDLGEDEKYNKIKAQKHKKHRHHKKHRRKHKGALFEGERVPYLVGQKESKDTQMLAENEDNAVHEDDYVLQKLFKKTGIQTAMRHDTIMQGGDADYALVEGEAQRVAKEAVKALKDSRRQCWQAETGVPSWTGQSGALRSHNAPTQNRFGKKKAIRSPARASLDSKPKAGTSSTSNEGPMTSKELLSRMRARNRLLEPITEPEQVEEEAPEESQDDIPPPSAPLESVQDDHMELLTDIRNFVAFGGLVDGRASTQEILAQFSDRLPPGSSPLFKFMLSEVCEFHRMPSGEGMWRLRNEFRW